MPLRIGTLFVVLVTSSIGVFAPILLEKLPFKTVNAVVSTIIKQFGTGIIIATVFVHVSGKFMQSPVNKTDRNTSCILMPH